MDDAKPPLAAAPATGQARPEMKIVSLVLGDGRYLLLYRFEGGS